MTIICSAGELAAAKLESPLYWAVIECVPTARLFVVKVAVPELNVPLPRFVAPSKKVTVPEGVSPDPETAALIVIDVPAVITVVDVLSVMVLADFSTVKVSCAEVELSEFPSPAYCAVIA